MYGRNYDPGMGICPPRVALAVRTPANQQSASGGGFPHRAGRYRPWGPSSSFPVCWNYRFTEGFLIRGMGSYPSRVTLAPHIPDWGFHTVGDGIDPRGHRFRPRFAGVAHILEGFLVWGCDLILSGWRWLYEPQIGVSTPCRVVSTKKPLLYRFSSPFSWICRCMEGFLLRGWDFILPGWRWLYEPQIGISTPCGAASTRGTAVFVPSLLELYTYASIYDPGWAPILPGWPWVYESRVRVSISAGRYRRVGPPFSSPIRRSGIFMEGFLNRGWGFIFTLCGGT